MLSSSGSGGALPPRPKQFLVQPPRAVDETSEVQILPAVAIEAGEEGVLRERVRGYPGESREIGGRDPALEPGRALRMEGSAVGPDGPQGTRRGTLWVGMPAADSVDRGGDLPIRSEGREEGDIPGSGGTGGLVESVQEVSCLLGLALHLSFHAQQRRERTLTFPFSR